ncbi:hypothetical protein [Caldimonas tepidiphila]|uniref:hypothetical protein n=1 Tax=Caldimonas tepidiphila TaxID=2315841 RepID=UPI0013002AB4|nr:hypothetical protein [Caldimonas tepidiphila]
MTFKLTVADIIELPIKITLNDAGKTASHFFHLSAQRISQEEGREALQALQANELETKDFLLEKVCGWRGQRLVVDDSGEPARFSREAFECLLSLAGLPAIVWGAYLRALVLSDGSEGRAKN